MGLNCSHNAWDGPYSSFMGWRREVAKAAGLPPLDLMEGFYQPLGCGAWGCPTLYSGDVGASRLKLLDESLPISWACLRPRPLHELLHHSDCDGEIPPYLCRVIADDLEEVADEMPDHWEKKTGQFIQGLRNAAAKNEPLEFR